MLESDDNDGACNNAKIVRYLPAGAYTIVTTTSTTNTTGSYTLSVTATRPMPATALHPSHSDVPFKPDGDWQRFTVGANVPVKVVANTSTSSLPVLEATSLAREDDYGTHERYINQPATARSALHLLIDRNSEYAYSVQTKCHGDKFSPWTSWNSLASIEGCRALPVTTWYPPQHLSVSRRFSKKRLRKHRRFRPAGRRRVQCVDREKVPCPRTVGRGRLICGEWN